MKTKSTARTIEGLRSFKGTLISIRMSANDNSESISIIEHRMPMGEATPLHIHRNEDEIFHLLHGRIRFDIDGKTVVAQAGDIIVAPKLKPHRFRVESVDGAHCLTIMRGKDFESMVMQMSAPATTDIMPYAQAPTPEMIDALVAACSRHCIDIVGPPLAA